MATVPPGSPGIILAFHALTCKRGHRSIGIPTQATLIMHICAFTSADPARPSALHCRRTNLAIRVLWTGMVSFNGREREGTRRGVLPWSRRTKKRGGYRLLSTAGLIAGPIDAGRLRGVCRVGPLPMR